MKWKKDYGDGQETDDLVLWVNGEPTETIISPVSSRCYVLYIDGAEVGYYDTIKEAKDYFYHEG